MQVITIPAPVRIPKNGLDAPGPNKANRAKMIVNVAVAVGGVFDSR